MIKTLLDDPSVSRMILFLMMFLIDGVQILVLVFIDILTNGILDLSAPRILNTDYNKGGNGNIDYVALERVSYYFTGGYVFDLSETTKFKPALLVKATNGAPLSFDITANFLFNETFWIGGSYRINESAAAIGGIADFQVSKQLRIGYAYEYPISDLRAYTSGTHEILLMFEIFKSKRIKSPRYF